MQPAVSASTCYPARSENSGAMNFLSQIDHCGKIQGGDLRFVHGGQEDAIFRLESYRFNPGGSGIFVDPRSAVRMAILAPSPNGGMGLPRLRI
jgi:hypothetical protein